MSDKKRLSEIEFTQGEREAVSNRLKSLLLRLKLHEADRKKNKCRWSFDDEMIWIENYIEWAELKRSEDIKR